MIKLEHVVEPSTDQMMFVIEGMRNPMNSWDKSDSGVCLKSLPEEVFPGGCLPEFVQRKLL